MTSKALAIAAATMAFLGSAVPMGPTSATPWQDIRVSAPSQQAPARSLSQAQTSSRDEVERISSIAAVPSLPRSFARERKHRTSGDRAHKRMKLRRASGRR